MAHLLPRFRFSVNPCFVAIPQLYLFIFRKSAQSDEELLTELLHPAGRARAGVLSGRTPSRAGDDAPYRTSTPPDTSPQYGHGRPLRSRRSLCARPGSSNSSRICSFCSPEIRGVLPGLFLAMRPSTPYELKALTIFLIALSDSSKRLHDLLPGRTDKEHDNDETSPVRFPVPGFPSCLEIGKGCVLGIGDDISRSHDPLRNHKSQEMSRYNNIIRELFMRIALDRPGSASGAACPSPVSPREPYKYRG